MKENDGNVYLNIFKNISTSYEFLFLQIYFVILSQEKELFIGVIMFEDIYYTLTRLPSDPTLQNLN
jgi:hypothetical protein